ncbi:MAG: putative membrane protein YedE/YeeE [Verrucomicrobiales bacterium]|jgi:uncharacterized membrane protein YedE/YeeE
MKSIQKNLLVFVAGLIFGAGLALSGMTDPGKVIGFLDVAGDWDATLAFVMAGAVVTFAIGARWLPGIPKASSDPVSRRLITGAIFFGVGWGISGFCPGPALANLAALGDHLDGLWFVLAMTAGMILAQRVRGVDQ